jgi:hypothetical protein
MRLLFIAASLGIVSGAVASATEPPDARSAYVERRGLIEADAHCHLFAPDIRAALQVGAAQARGSLLRAGWTSAQVNELERAVVAAGRARPCEDRRTAAAAADARAAADAWVSAYSMDFPGWERVWVARRGSGDGWRLSQTIDAPVAAVFGVRDRAGAQRLAVVVPTQRGQPAPTSARLVMRDVARGPLVEVGLPQRMAFGLEAGAPAPDSALTAVGSRTVERSANGSVEVAFIFPDAAFRNLLALDPRETLELRLVRGRVTHRLLVEVGDIAAARAFLLIR